MENLLIINLLKEMKHIEDFKKSKLDNILQQIKDHLLIPTDMGVSRNTTFYNATNAALEFDSKTLELVNNVVMSF